MIELFEKAIHPIQYLLIGLTLIIFYSLLLAISEYLSFDISYLISALLVILLISFYVLSVYKSSRIGAVIFLLWLFLWSYVHNTSVTGLLIACWKYSFVCVVGISNVFTRKINWFDVLNPKTN